MRVNRIEFVTKCCYAYIKCDGSKQFLFDLGGCLYLSCVLAVKHDLWILMPVVLLHFKEGSKKGGGQPNLSLLLARNRRLSIENH